LRTPAIRGQNTTNPKQTHALLQGRLSAAAKLNDQLADIYKERAQIEAAYVSALQKLQSKRGGGGGVARDTLGSFSSVWEAIWGEVQEVSVLLGARRELDAALDEKQGEARKEPKLTSSPPVWPVAPDQAVQVHSNLERKMKDEVETPLRSMAVKGEWGKQGTVRPARPRRVGWPTLV
jgi:hypothetical protein